MRAVSPWVVVLLATAARGQAPGTLPDWLGDAPKSPDLDRKVEGTFPDALPLVAYDPNLGWGFGVGGHLTFDGPRSAPLFDYEAYRHRFYLQIYATTLGYQGHFLSYDGIHVGDTPYNVRAVVLYERNTNANYF